MASSIMSEDGTPTAATRNPLPVVTEAARPAPRALAAAEFLSQLIAERDRLQPQRERRRAPVGHAVASYDLAAQQTVRRMPPGYRRTLTV